MAHFDDSPSAAKRVLWPFYLALAIFVALVVQATLQGHGLDYYKTEAGPFEIGAFVAMGCALIGFIALAPRVVFGPGWHVAVLMALLMMRELDFDKRFTEKGVLQLRLYSGDYPFLHKVVGICVLVLILVTLYRFVRHGAGPFLRGLRGGVAWAWWLAGSMVLVVIAKSLDGLARKLEPFGIAVSPETDWWASFIEEGLEWIFPMMVIMAVCSWAQQHHARP
ncbi:hypothetical protein [Dinoroseobacter sp. S76]|uniref:hypothetical protein n=1 Tax=Dinoroseobacter sp. S76 TaxID=3415124 RepID=UPI003C7B163E